MIERPSNCRDRLQSEGKPYPRTCPNCGIYRCRFGTPAVESPNVDNTRSRRIVALKGLAGSGKSTVAAHLVEHHGYTRIRFAGPLKAMAAALGFTPDEIEGHLKEVPNAKLTHANFSALADRIVPAFAAINVTPDMAGPIPVLCGRDSLYAAAAFAGVLAQVIARGEAKGGATPRLLMQMIGTEWGRDMIGADVWIRLWRDAVDKLPAGKSVVVDDCRFPNEADAARAIGGVLVEVKRPGAGAGAAGHSSEGQSLGEPAATLHNVGTVGALFNHVDALARDLSWVEPRTA